jgi:Undecaprenyl-phosphate galactose phosphotransferase WbaP
MAMMESTLPLNLKLSRARAQPWTRWEGVFAFGLFLGDGLLLDGILWVSSQGLREPDVAGIFQPLLLRAWILPLALLLLGAYPGYALHPAVKLRKRVYAVFLAFLVNLVDVWVWHPQALRALPGLGLTYFSAAVAWPLGSRIIEWLLRRWGVWGTPVVILGAGREGRALLRTLQAEPSLGLIPVGFYDDAPALQGRRVGGLEVLGSLAAAREAPSGVRTAIVAIPSLSRPALGELVTRLGCPRVLVVPDMDGVQSMWLRGTDLGGRFALDITHKHLHLSGRFLKRAVDLGFGLPIALVCAPVILLLAACIRLASPGSPFYYQVREGRDGRRIRVWKLRTMYQDAQARLDRLLATDPEARLEWERSFKLQADPRILPGIGRFLRRSSLDELPQLWNVLKGEMSLVGPRPFPHYHLDVFGASFRNLRCSVMPGMTGLWQVSARNGGDIRDQERLDSFYIHNWSLWQDVDLLLRTVGAVLRGTGA